MTLLQLYLHPSITEINTCIDTLRKITGVIDSNSVIILRTID